MFAEARRGQHGVDTLFVSIGRSIGKERRDLVDGRGQAGQREGSPPEQGGAIGRDGKLQASLGSLISDEGVERILGPGEISDRRCRVRRWADEGPVWIVLGSLLDPATQNVLLGGGERPM